MSLTKDRELADLLYNSYGDLSLLLADLSSLAEDQAKQAVAVQNHNHDKNGHESHAPAPTEAQKTLTGAQQKTVALLHDTFSFAMRRFTSAQSIGPGIAAFRKKPYLNQDPRNLFVWSVDDAEDMRFCADNGVDVLITNTPSFARSVLGYN